MKFLCGTSGRRPPQAGDAFDSCPRAPNLPKHMFVLGIDPGLSVTGYGLVESGHPPRAHLAGVIRTEPSAPMAVRLAELYNGLMQVIAESNPNEVALETVFTNRNLQTAISVGRASGVAILAAAQAGLPVSEYVPTAVKSAITGDGSASKRQIQEMVARLLHLDQPPKPADAADALAIALCHLRVAPLEAAR
jgi:crossover junction endodeoxyribonuclease RuvC